MTETLSDKIFHSELLLQHTQQIIGIKLPQSGDFLFIEDVQEAVKKLKGFIKLRTRGALKENLLYVIDKEIFGEKLI